jgi:glycosyltransferase involved in cell wall biosynthesis
VSNRQPTQANALADMAMSDSRLSVAHINLARGYRGGERQTQVLVECLAKFGWRQKLVARRGELLAERCASIDGLHLIEVPGNVIAAAIALDHVSLVNVHEGRGIQAAFINRFFRGVPYVVTRRVQTGPKHNRLTRMMYKGAAEIIILSEAIRKSMLALDADLHCTVIPDANSELQSDPRTAQKIRSRLGGGFIVGHVGELDDAQKGQKQIVDVAKRLRVDVPELSFVLVGSGRDEAGLRLAASELNNVHFAGQVNNVGDYLAAFDIFLYPSRHEGLGSSMLDALAYGLPVVATKAGGIPEIIENEVNGFLCEVDDIDAFKDAIVTLYRDSKLRQKISAANLEKAARFSPENMTKRYIEVYKRVIDVVIPEKAAI